MARITSYSPSDAWLPPEMSAALKRRAVQGCGLVLLASAGAVLAALVSFDPADPSLNNATDGIAANLLGEFGAYLADLLLAAFGVAVVLPVAALGMWGWRLIGARPAGRLWLRGGALLLTVPLVAIPLAALPVPAGWPLTTGLGGLLGDLLLTHLVGLGGERGLSAGSGLWLTLSAAGAGAAWLFGLGVSLAEWRAFARRLGEAGRAAAAMARVAFALARRLRRRWMDRAVMPGPAAATNAGPQAAPGAAPEPTSAAALVAAKAPRMQSGRKAETARQGRLPFAAGDGYHSPPLDLLTAPAPAIALVNADALQQNARLLASVLKDFGVHGEIVKVRPGPVITLYELEPAPGTKSSRVIGLADDIARSMSTISVRVAVVPGRNVIGIELPNQRRETVYLRELLASRAFERNGGELTLALGKDIGGGPVLADLARMPHLLIAGTTGSGKSVAINTMILSLLYQLGPDVCKFILIDPKMLELSVYDGIPHLLAPVVTDAGKAVVALKWTVREMEERYRVMSQLGVRNIAGYNARIAEAMRKGETLVRRVQTGFDEDGRPRIEEQALDLEQLPLIVVIVDEMADLMLVAGKDIEAAVQRLAQMARAAGIHLIMATQRPSVDVITGTIKANFPTRVSFQVTSKIDSRTILGEQGAEQLLGQGDMLYMAGGGRLSRVHGPFVSDEEVEQVVAFLRRQGEPNYVQAVTEEEEDGAWTAPDAEADGGSSGDELYREAVAVVARDGKASTSYVQRRLQIGYNRAARLIERMEAEGLVSKPDRVGRREVLIAEDRH